MVDVEDNMENTVRTPAHSAERAKQQMPTLPIVFSNTFLLLGKEELQPRNEKVGNVSS